MTDSEATSRLERRFNFHDIPHAHAKLVYRPGSSSMPRIPYKLKEKVQLDVATKAEAQALLAILEKDAGEIAVRPINS